MKDTGYAIPPADSRYDETMHVTVKLTDRTVRNYECKKTDGWQERVRRFVQRVYDSVEIRIDTVAIAHVKDGKRIGTKVFQGHKLSTIN